MSNKKWHIPGFFRHDLPRKFIALFFAALIWLAIDSRLHDFTTFHNVPINLQYDRNLVILETEALTVDITLRGARKRLDRIGTTDILVTAKVPPPQQEGIYFYDLRISSENVTVPPGTRISEITPAHQPVHLDRVVRKNNVPIRVRFEGELREGYRRSVTVLPSAATIIGPSRILRDVKELVTEPIALDSSITSSFELEAKIVQIPDVRMPNSVRVNIEIERHNAQQEYHGLTLHVLNSPNLLLAPETELPKVSVTLHGPKVILESLDELSIRPFIDVSTITVSGRYRRPVQVWIHGAANVTAEYVHPSMVEVQLQDFRVPSGSTEENDVEIAE